MWPCPSCSGKLRKGCGINTAEQRGIITPIRVLATLPNASQYTVVSFAAVAPCSLWTLHPPELQGIFLLSYFSDGQPQNYKETGLGTSLYELDSAPDAPFLQLLEIPLNKKHIWLLYESLLSSTDLLRMISVPSPRSFMNTLDSSPEHLLSGHITFNFWGLCHCHGRAYYKPYQNSVQLHPLLSIQRIISVWKRIYLVTWF